MKYYSVKRGLDIMLSFIGIILLIPVLILISIVIRITMGNPIIFKQRRIGYKEQIFQVYKFRTMTNDTDEKGELLPDHERLTTIGRIIRKLSLDELPQLYNVIKGDMSFIGPRPLYVKYLPYYSNRERRRHRVRPGITGLAQVKGRNTLDWDDRLELDVKYVENMSIVCDFKILIMTFVQIFKINEIKEQSLPDLSDARKNNEKDVYNSITA